VPTDAATAVLITLRDRVQALHEAHVLVADSDPVSPEGASVLADAAARLGDVLAASSEVLDPARTEAVRSGVGHLGEFAEAVRAADAVADAAAAQLEEIPHALVVGPVGDRTRHEARERRTTPAAALAEAAASPAAQDLLHRADRLVVTPGPGAGAGRAAGTALCAAARADLDAFTAMTDALGDASGPGETLLRSLRGVATRVASSVALALDARDDGEKGSATGGKGRKRALRLVRAVGRVADSAREVTDLVATGRHLVDLADLAHRRRDPGFTYGLLHAGASAAEVRARARLAEALDAALDAARAKKLRSWLAD